MQSYSNDGRFFFRVSERALYTSKEISLTRRIVVHVRKES